MSDLPLLGFGLPVAGAWATPSAMLRVARRAEELGYASLWTFQRLLAPVDGGVDADDELNPGTRPPDDPTYRSVHDPLLPLAYVAAATERIGLGTATICAPLTPPVALAKSAASLDHLTGGRLTLGLGLGWMRSEYAAAGVPFERRGARMEEYLRCLHALWGPDPVEFAGEFYSVPRSHAGPKPLRPRPPVLLGGAAPAALRRAGRLAEGWIGSTREDLGRIAASINLVRDGARAAGRDPGAVRVLVRGVVDLTDGDRSGDRRPLQGSRAQVLDDLVALRAQGVTEVLLDPNFASAIGAPDVDPVRAGEEAERVLEAFAPTRL